MLLLHNLPLNVSGQLPVYTLAGVRRARHNNGEGVMVCTLIAAVNVNGSGTHSSVMHSEGQRDFMR